MTMPLPSERILNRALTESASRDVIMIDVIPVHTGQRITLSFDDINSAWRQGVWLATDGMLRVNGVQSPQLVLWQDTAPAQVDIVVEEADGLLRLYNVWDSGRGLGEHESQRATSGMLMTLVEEGVRRYECNGIGLEPDFNDLVFTVRSS